MTRRLQHRDVSEPIERLVREFCTQHDVPALYHSELSRPLIEHANEMVRQAMNDGYEAGKGVGKLEG